MKLNVFGCNILPIHTFSTTNGSIQKYFKYIDRYIDLSIRLQNEKKEVLNYGNNE